MALAPLKKLNVDELGDSAYMTIAEDCLIHRSKEQVVDRVQGIDLAGIADSGTVSLSFGLRDFVDGKDEDAPILILDMSESHEVCGIEIPHYSHFNQWLVPHLNE